MTFPRKRIRLPAGSYLGLRRYFLTFCCFERCEHFLQEDFNQYFVGRLREHAAAQQFSVPAYCLMPDHAHLLVEALAVNSNLAPFVKVLKQATGFEFERRTGDRLWQRYYYDHVLRPKGGPKFGGLVYLVESGASRVVCRSDGVSIYGFVYWSVASGSSA